jgi:hypothetical protein
MRKKTAKQNFATGDTNKVGAKKLAAKLAAEPKTQRGLVCPGTLQGEAADIFHFFAGQLELSGLDAKPDSQALAIAAESLATAWKAARMLKRQGEVRMIPIFEGRGRARKIVGYRQARNRWFSVKIESEKLFDRIAGKFGLVGPQSRAGLEVQHSPSIARNPSLWEKMNRPRKPSACDPTPPLPPEPVQ